MRIAIVRHTGAPAGGTETYLDTLAPALAGRGHDIATWFEEVGALPGRALEGQETSWLAAGSADGAIPQLARWHPDVLYVHGLRSLDLERSLLALAPAVLFAHSYIGTCISGSKMHAWPACTGCTRALGPACLALYFPRRCGGISPVTMWRQYGIQRRRHRQLGSYRRILVASEHMAREYARHGHAAVTRVVPLPVLNGAGRSPVEDPAAWRLLYLGRLEWNKGPDLAIAAAAMAARTLDRPVTLTVAGTGSMAGSLREMAVGLRKASPRLRVEMPGWLSPGERGEVLDRTDLLLVPSRWPEPFGLVGPEAGAHGVPAVAFDVGGIGDWLSDGVNGVLVRRMSDVRAFSDAILQCLGRSDGLARMRQESRRLAERFSVSAHVSTLESVLTDAVGERRPGAGAS